MMRADLLRRLGQTITVVSVGVIFYATLRPNIGAELGGADTMWHFLLFLPLGAGVALSLAQLDPLLQRRARLAIMLVAILFAAFTELAQGPIDGRVPSMSDFFADVAGFGVGLLGGGWAAARARRDTN